MKNTAVLLLVATLGVATLSAAVDHQANSKSKPLLNPKEESAPEPEAAGISTTIQPESSTEPKAEPKPEPKAQNSNSTMLTMRPSSTTSGGSGGAATTAPSAGSGDDSSSSSSEEGGKGRHRHHQG